MRYLSDNEAAQLLLIVVVAVLVATIGYQIMNRATKSWVESLGFYLCAGGSLIAFAGTCGTAGL